MRFILTVMAVLLAGCGTGEKRQARRDFLNAVAAVKASTKGATTFDEFHQTMLSLQTSYEANEPYLSDVTNQFLAVRLDEYAINFFWQKSIESPYRMTLGYRDGNGGGWTNKEASLCIEALEPGAWNSRVADKLSLPDEQQGNDSDFYPSRYMRIGTAKLNSDCALLMQKLR